MSQSQQPQLNPVAIGIDLGSFQSVIAVTRRAGVQVLTNQANFRETPNVVGFGDSERYLGEAGLTRLKTNFNNTVVFITRFLGLPHDSLLVAQEKKFVTAKTTTTEGGRMAFEVNYRSDECKFLPEQIVAAFLNKLQLILETHKISRQEQVVLSVPNYYNIFERRALFDAAAICGMKVSRLINESTAVAIDYGLARRQEFLQKQPKYVLFVDLGHSKLSLTTIGFTREKISVVCQHNQRNLGCRDMDYLILQFYREVFKKQSNGLDFMQNKKAFIKMIETVEKQRKILSANSQQTINMEYLTDEEDLNYTMKREQFEAIIEPILTRLGQAIQKHKGDLDALGIKLTTIELVGGGTRIPSFIRIIQNLFKVDPSRTINSSEAIAKGCAIMSAFKNPLFRPSDFTIEQINYNPITACWKYGQDALALNNNFNNIQEGSFAAENKSVLFQSGCILPVVRQLRFKTNEPIGVLLTYNPSIVGFNQNIANFLSNTHKMDSNKSLVMNFLMDENGLVSLHNAYIQPDHPKPAPTHSQVAVKLQEHYYCNITPQLLKDLQARQKTMQMNDRSTQQTYQFKNKLQGYIYTTKEKLTTIYKEYISKSQYENMTSQLDKINQWLYDSDPQTVQTHINSKSQQITAILDPINVRINQQKEYYKLINESKQEINGFTKAIESYGRGTIPLNQRDRALNEINNIRKYLLTVEEDYKKAPKYRPFDPSISDINRIMMSLKEKTEAVLERAQPPKTSFFDKVLNKFK